MYTIQGMIRKSINNTFTQWERLGYVANNLANINTNAYKPVRFEQMLDEDGYLRGAIRTDYSQGSIKITSNPYDVAIDGQGFIPVVSPSGEVQYTRDGGFKQGTLVRFANPEGLEQADMNRLTATEDSGEPVLVKDHTCFKQNNIEISNTNVYTSTSEMLRLNASMLASTQMLKVIDDMYNKAINIREG